MKICDTFFLMRKQYYAAALFFLLPLFLPAQAGPGEDPGENTVIEKLQADFPDISPLYIRAVGETPRKPFIPEPFLSLAGTDLDIPVLRDAVIPSPALAVRLLYEGGVRAGGSVLIIGKAGGYLGAAASLLSENVTVVELSDELYRKYPAIYQELEINTVNLVPSLAGAAESGFMFDTVIVHGATPFLPPEISSFLRPSGILLLPITGESGYQNLLKIQYGNGLTVRSLGETFFPLVRELYRNY